MLLLTTTNAMCVFIWRQKLLCERHESSHMSACLNNFTTLFYFCYCAETLQGLCVKANLFHRLRRLSFMLIHCVTVFQIHLRRGFCSYKWVLCVYCLMLFMETGWKTHCPIQIWRIQSRATHHVTFAKVTWFSQAAKFESHSYIISSAFHFLTSINLG